MNFAALATLLEQLIPLGIQAYEQLVQNGSASKTTAELLAQADLNWDAIAATAKGQIPPAPTQ